MPKRSLLSQTWLLAIVVLATASCQSSTGLSPNRFPSDPARAEVRKDDVDRFWRAWDAGGQSGSSAVVQRIYLDSASPTLRTFAASRGVTAAAIASVTQAYPQYFRALRAWWPPPTMDTVTKARRKKITSRKTVQNRPMPTLCCKSGQSGMTANSNM